MLEKSPPTVVRTRFVQALFPNSKSIVFRRHPIPVALATRRWSDSTMFSLARHWVVCHEIWRADLLEHGGVELPRPMLAGIGQRRARRGRDAQVLERALAAAQRAADLRSEWARPRWQNSIATNCPQQVKPCAWRSAYVRFTRPGTRFAETARIAG